MAADYDSGEITERERQAAKNQSKISTQNIKDVENQLARQLSNFDFADAQNRALADTQLRQNSRKTSEDRYEAQRDLQVATLGLLGSMGSAMNGSTTGNLMRMLESRNDKDNSTYWAQHQVNQDAVENAYNDSLNQNLVARRDAMQSAEKAVRDINADWSANMNNINPNLFAMASPADSAGGHKSADTWDEAKARQNNAAISGYLIPDAGTVGSTAVQPYMAGVNGNIPARNRVRGGAGNAVGGDYFSQLMNRFNGR